MVREDWKSVNIRVELVALAEVEAEVQHYPNVTQFINEVLRERLMGKQVVETTGPAA